MCTRTRAVPRSATVSHEILSCPWEPVPRLIPDEQSVIQTTLKELADRDGCCLIVTTGGTGPSTRDVTPEATVAVCDKMLPASVSRCER